MNPARSDARELPAASVLPDGIGARRLNQGITATWWYTASGVLVFQVMVVFIWLSVLAGMRLDPTTLTVIGVGGLVWCAASVPLLLQYRHRDDMAGPMAGWRGILLPLGVAVVFGAVCGIASGLWLVGMIPVIQSLTLLNWPRGVRLRLVIVSVLVIAGVWFIDWRMTFDGADPEVAGAWGLFGFFAATLPLMTGRRGAPGCHAGAAAGRDRCARSAGPPSAGDRAAARARREVARPCGLPGAGPGCRARTTAARADERRRGASGHAGSRDAVPRRSAAG
jgi:hypothetical protein